MSIIGTGVTGSLRGKTASPDDDNSSSGSDGASSGKPSLSIGQALAQRLESLVAYSSYSVLSGEAKEQPGDGRFHLALTHTHTHTLTLSRFNSPSPSPSQSITDIPYIPVFYLFYVLCVVFLLVCSLSLSLVY